MNNIYFGGCATPSIVLLAEMMLGVMLNAMVVGIIFARFSRANERHRSILFSKHAILKRVDGRLYFMFQAFEMRTQQALIEAHVRCYAIRHEHRDLGVNRKERPGMSRRESFIRGTSAVDKFTKFFRPYPMRLQHPDDELGGMLLLTVPNVVVHRLDAWSPLVPTTLLEHCNQIGKVKEDDSSSAYRFPDVQQRQVRKGPHAAPDPTPTRTRPARSTPWYTYPVSHQCALPRGTRTPAPYHPALRANAPSRSQSHRSLVRRGEQKSRVGRP